ncbi:MAG TPA: 2-phospho-L-lactate guanylyltransferase [Anaerolineaceae bacterium]|nr:2-phospho-L-lactate guanylyltransferase [Anaerolineaceae bacterium]
MSLWAIIPVKPLRRGKSRLAGVLTEDERALLNYSMLSNTLNVLGEIPEVTDKLVVSRDPAALALAREYGARTLQEDGNPGLNTALRRATVVAQAYAARGVLILPADLPLLTPPDLAELLLHANKPPVVALAPDRRGDGTNAMLLSPADLIDFHYGPGSFQKHVSEAKKADVRVEVCSLFSLGLDLDLPEDLELLRQMKALTIDL